MLLEECGFVSLCTVFVPEITGLLPDYLSQHCKCSIESTDSSGFCTRVSNAFAYLTVHRRWPVSEFLHIGHERTFQDPTEVLLLPSSWRILDSLLLSHN